MILDLLGQKRQEHKHVEWLNHQISSLCLNHRELQNFCNSGFEGPEKRDFFLSKELH